MWLRSSLPAGSQWCKERTWVNCKLITACYHNSDPWLLCSVSVISANKLSSQELTPMIRIEFLISPSPEIFASEPQFPFPWGQMPVFPPADAHGNTESESSEGWRRYYGVLKSSWHQCCHFRCFNMRSDVLREISDVWCFSDKSDVQWAVVFHISSLSRLKIS